MLSEQNSGLSWRTENGVETYQRLRSRMLEQLNELQEDCLKEMESCQSCEYQTGLFILADTAKELFARLDGTWSFEQEKFMYVDFLRSGNIMLNDDFMPELESTFCGLSEFNVLERIRRHVEGPKLTLEEQIEQVYGKNRECNNYGAAARIVEYLQVRGEWDDALLPENHEMFIEQTAKQMQMRFREFRETYALAVNYGQIMQSDAFCHTLEDTVRYW